MPAFIDILHWQVKDEIGKTFSIDLPPISTTRKTGFPYIQKRHDDEYKEQKKTT